MDQYGQYETVAEISTSGIGSVWTARRAGDAAPRFIVKIYRPEAHVLSDAEIRQGAYDFLARAEIQRQAASAPGASHWAPVYELGSCAGGAYYVTDYYPCSIRLLLNQHVRISPAGLHAIAAGIAKGVDELGASCGRSHGNLKPGNVLMDRPPASGAVRVALADPGELVGEVGEADDLRALGGLVYALVTERPAPRISTGPIERSSEWRRLGRCGDGWRDLCNGLLLSDSEKPLRRMTELGAPLSRLRPSPRRRRAALAGAACVAGAVGVGLASPLLHRSATHPLARSNDDPATRHAAPDYKAPTTQDVSLADPTACAYWIQSLARPVGVRSPTLASAYEEAQKKWTAGLSRPDPVVQARLQSLRDNLERVERDLESARAIGADAPPADAMSAEQESLYLRAKQAVELDPSAADRDAKIWRDLRDEYGQWLQTQADHRQIARLLSTARGQVEAGQFAAARSTLQKADGLDPQNAESASLRQRATSAESALVAAAAQTESRGDWSAALDLLTQLLHADPAHADTSEVQLVRAKIADDLLHAASARVASVEDGDWRMAADLLDRLDSIWPANADAAALRDRIRTKVQARDEAIGLRDNGANREAARDLDGAITFYRQAVQRDPTFADARVRAAAILVAMGQQRLTALDYAGARKLAAEAINLNPGADDVGRLLKSIDDSMRADDQRAKERADALTEEANADLKSGDPQKALKALEAARTDPPVDLRVKDLRGQIQRMLDSAQLALDQGKAQEKADRYSDAMADYLRAADLGNVSAMLRLGSVYLNGSGRPKDAGEAAKWYRKALDRQSDNAEAKAGLAQARQAIAAAEVVAPPPTPVAPRPTVSRPNPIGADKVP